MQVKDNEYYFPGNDVLVVVNGSPCGCNRCKSELKEPNHPVNLFFNQEFSSDSMLQRESAKPTYNNHDLIFA